MSRDWVPVLSTTDAAYAAIVTAKLRDKGIAVVAVDKQDQVNIHLNQFSAVQIMVRKDDVIRAKYIIH